MKQLLGITLVVGIIVTFGNSYANTQTNKIEEKIMSTKKMKVEIWSDMVCPFCYIGKRRFEAALSKFAYANDIEVVWRSFQLNPNLVIDKDNYQNVYQYLAKAKGISYEQSLRMHEGVVNMANEDGLDYRFDKAVVTNSQNAHRVMQMAQNKGVGDKAEELLFKAYFTEGKDLNKIDILAQIGAEIGLIEEDVVTMLTGHEYVSKVIDDMEEASKIGIKGVPFFVFDRRYAVSGAQPTGTFIQTLQTSYDSWQKNK